MINLAEASLLYNQVRPKCHNYEVIKYDCSDLANIVALFK
jgi:hypothetical protein